MSVAPLLRIRWSLKAALVKPSAPAMDDVSTVSTWVTCVAPVMAGSGGWIALGTGHDCRRRGGPLSSQRYEQDGEEGNANVLVHPNVLILLMRRCDATAAALPGRRKNRRGGPAALRTHGQVGQPPARDVPGIHQPPGPGPGAERAALPQSRTRDRSTVRRQGRRW